MSEIHSGVGAYVADALDHAEREEFEEHLAVCETCQREELELRETISELSRLTSAAPPPALKSSVQAAIGSVRALPPQERLGDTPTGAAPASRPDRGLSVTPVDELAVRRQRRLTRALSLAVAAMLVVVLGLGAWVASLVQRDAPVATRSVETELLQAPDLRAYTIELKDGGTATILASKSLNRAMLSSPDLPGLAPDRTYQLWTIDGPLTAPTRVTPDAMVAGGRPAKVWLTGPVAESDAVAISIEQAGGASAPTNIQGATAL